MLEKRSVSEGTFKLLNKIMSDIYFSDFFLAGETALSLQLGHRKSVDLDLFTKNNIDVAELDSHLKEKYNFKQRYIAKNTLKGDINGVFIDCIRHGYPLIKPLVLEENIRIASMEDICAMKLSAITDNGTRLKYFVDIAFLSTRFSLNEMFSFYRQKYNEDNLLSPAKALLFFDEIDFESEPVELFGAEFDWKKTSGRLVAMINNPEKRFADLPIEHENNIDDDYEIDL